MKVAVVYVYPLANQTLHYGLAKRFADTYRWSEPGEPHDLHVMLTGGDMKNYSLSPLAGLTVQYHPHDNVGWDIGAFQWAADHIECDLMICLGSYVHFHKQKWLVPMVNAFLENGPALYGCWAYLSPNWHVRTTAFWFPPQLLRAYPNKIGSSRSSRYDFEHGKNSFTRFVLSAGMECWMVSWIGVFPFSMWSNVAPGPDESLVLDRFTHR